MAQAIPTKNNTLVQHSLNDFKIENMSKIIYLSLTLDPTGMRFKRPEFEFVKKKNTIRINCESIFGGKTTNIKHNQLSKIDSMVRKDCINNIHFYAWCMPEQEKKTISAMIIAMNFAIRERERILDKMSHIWALDKKTVC